MPTRFRSIAACMAAAVALTSCGDGGSDDPAAVGSGATTPVEGGAPTTPDGSAEPATDDSRVPAVRVLSVPSGEEIDLAAAVPDDRPVLLWFWAPH